MQALRGVCTRRQRAPALLHGIGANINNTLALSAAAMLLHLGDSMQPRVLVWQRTPKGAAHRERALRRRGGRVARSSRHSVAPLTENARAQKACVVPAEEGEEYDDGILFRQAVVQRRERRGTFTLTRAPLHVNCDEATQSERVINIIMSRFLLIAVTTSFARCGHSSPPSPPPAIPVTLQLAKTPQDVIIKTFSGFASTGVLCGGWTAVTKRSVAAGWVSAQRWGRVSAGFSGGQALGQYLRGVDDRYCRFLGAACAGVFGSATVADIPRNLATYLAFTYVLESFEAKAEPSAAGMSRPSTSRPDKNKPSTNIFGEPVGEGLRPGGFLHRLAAGADSIADDMSKPMPKKHEAP